MAVGYMPYFSILLIRPKIKPAIPGSGLAHKSYHCSWQASPIVDQFTPSLHNRLWGRQEMRGKETNLDYSHSIALAQQLVGSLALAGDIGVEHPEVVISRLIG